MLDDGLAVVGEPHVMTGMTPNPLLAFSSSSSPSIDDVTPTAGQPPAHPKGGGGGGNDDDDDDDGGGGGSPNNPLDLPLMRISIPEPAATPLIPMHMGGTSVMVPNPMISQFSVPSPLASPTYTVDDTDTETDGNTTTNANATTTSTTSSWPYYSQSQQPQPPPPSASSSSVGTSASTIHAMAKVVVGSAAADGVEELVVVAADGIVGEGMGGSSSCSHARDEVGEEEYDTVDDGENMDMEEYYDHPTHSTNGQQRLRRRANTMSAKMEADVTNRMQYVTSNLPPSTTATTSDKQGQEAVIFGEEDHHHHLSQPMNSQDHYYQQQQPQQPHQEYAPQTVLRIPSPASPPPPSSNMVRSYSYSGGNASAYYGSIMASAHSSSGSLYSEHTMSHSETDSPTMENCWRIGDSSISSSVGVIANSANAVIHDGEVGERIKPQHHVMSSSDSTAVPQVHFHTHQPLTTTTTSSSSGITPKTAGKNGSPQVVAATSSSSSLQQQTPRPPPPPPADKRQKRLERNRESARVSRRRRKFYLEELECKVTKLSEEMDTGRMKHACDALPSVRNARAEVLNEAERCLSYYYPTTIPNPLSTTSITMTREEEELSNNNANRKLSSSGIHHNVTVVPPPPPPPPPAPPPCGPHMMQQQQSATLNNNVDGTSLLFTQPLSRTNDELQIVQIFMKQQLSSLVQPTMTKFVLWLSLQNEEYYRGGRSASERLSAARIGERVSFSISLRMWLLILLLLRTNVYG